MTIAAFGFGLVILLFSLLFLFNYVRGHASIRQNRHSLTRQRQLQARLQADLQARFEADARKFEEERHALLSRAGGNADRHDVGHAA